MSPTDLLAPTDPEAPPTSRVAICGCVLDAQGDVEQPCADAANLEAQFREAQRAFADAEQAYQAAQKRMNEARHEKGRWEGARVWHWSEAQRAAQAQEQLALVQQALAELPVRCTYDSQDSRIYVRPVTRGSRRQDVALLERALALLPAELRPRMGGLAYRFPEVEIKAHDRR